MSYREQTSDLLASGLPAIGHGCNTRGSMGGGIAAQFRQAYPAMYAEYARLCRRGAFRLGEIFVWEADDVVIYNLATQVAGGADARLKDIETSVRAALEDAARRRLPALGLPKLGAGIGGLHWADVETVLRHVADQAEVDVVVVVRSTLQVGP